MSNTLTKLSYIRMEDGLVTEFEVVRNEIARPIRNFYTPKSLDEEYPPKPHPIPPHLKAKWIQWARNLYDPSEDNEYSESKTFLDIIKHKIPHPLVKTILESQFPDKIKKTILEFIYRDALTGLWNRRYYDHYENQDVPENANVPIKLKDTSLSSKPQTLLDVDELKYLNDSYGYAVGDKILRALGNAINEVIPGTGIRLGSDLIVIPLENRTLEEIEQILQNIRIIFQNTEIEINGKILRNK